MTDNNWQKVRVAFDDADGNRVEAVMWSLPDEASFYAEAFSAKDIVDGLWIQVPRAEGVVTPIYDLPTGAGAVIRLGRAYGDVRDFYISDVSGKWWSNSDGDTHSSHELIKHGGYEVLSEGIQLGDVK